MLYELTDEQASLARVALMNEEWRPGHEGAIEALSKPVDPEPTEEDIARAQRFDIAKDPGRFPGWTWEEISRWARTGHRRPSKP